MKRNCLLGLMVFVFLCSTSVWAAPSMVLKMALGDPKDSEMGVVGETFKKYVEEKSGGAIEVQTFYSGALGDETGAREALLTTPWATWRDAIVAELATAHPDLASKTQRIDIVRYGHAMAVPVPGVLSHIAPWRTPNKRQQLLKTEHLPVPQFAEAPRLRFARDACR